jgi:trans-AT polyketide synthase/acyltransferase/oxidoreductase domain-containing protein
MYRGIASEQLVISMGRAGLMAFFGTGGLDLDKIETAISQIQDQLKSGGSYGMNLLCTPERPELEEELVRIYLKRGVRKVEAAAFTQITPSLVWYRLKGLTLDQTGAIRARHVVVAKVSRPEVASLFMEPAPPGIVRSLVSAGRLTGEEADLSRSIPMADDICVEADSGGHTDGGVAYALIPAMLRLRDDMMAKYRYATRLRIGAAGGIGTPQAAAAAFIMGADFILTGSVNQCTVEAGTSGAVKDLLQDINIQDTAYAPAGDMFESGAKVQVVKKGVLFPARANKLYQLYQRHSSLEDIDKATKDQIEQRYFGRPLVEVWEEMKGHYHLEPAKLSKIASNPKQKMAAVFKWYFAYSSQLALEGTVDRKVDFQIHCGPALGAFNQWVKGTNLERWTNRHVSDIAELIMNGAADLLNRHLSSARKCRVCTAGSVAK